MKSRGLPGSDEAAPRSAWVRRVIVGGLGTAGATVALAAFAASAFANAANPLAPSTGDAVVNSNGTVTVTVHGEWNWGQLSGSSTQSNCTGRFGVGWAVDWWGAGSTPAAGPSTGTLVSTASGSPQKLDNQPLSRSVTITGKNGVVFHASSLLNGFDPDLCSNKDAQGFPEGPWSATATYPNKDAMPKQLCVNMYDLHGSPGQPKLGDFTSTNGDNSIKTNDFNPTSTGYCFTPQFVTPTITVDKTNNADGSGGFTDSETATSLGANVPFQVVITNATAKPVIIDSVKDAIPTGSAAGSVDCLTSAGHNVVGDTLAAAGSPGSSETCFFTKSNYLAGNNIGAGGSLQDDVIVAVHNTDGTGSGHDTSTVTAPNQAHLAANILLCSDPNAALPNTGKLVTSGGPTAVAQADNTLASTQVAPGTYTVTATAPTGFHIVVCGDSGASSRSVTLANGDSKTVNFFVAPNGSPNISYAKTGPSTGIAGSTGDYTITLTNTGSATAPGPLTFVDVLPAGETFNSVRPASDAGMSCTASGQLVTCTYSHDLAQNASASVVIRANFAQGTEGQTLRDCAGSTQNTANVCWPTDILKPNVTVKKSGPARGLLNDTGTYTIVATNDGPAPSSATTFTDSLPAGETFVAAGSSTACTANGQLVTCQLGALDAKGGVHDSASFTVVVRYTQTGDLTDCATIGGQPVPSCVTTHVDKPDLQVLKTGPATGTLNGTGTYPLTVVNNGAGASTATTFTDTLPAGETFVSSTGPGACSANGQVVTCQVGALAANGGSASYTVTVTYTKTGNLTDCATIGGQPVPSCVTTHIPGQPLLTVVKTNDANGDGVFHDSETAANPGDAVTFKVVITNNSTDPIALDSISDAYAAQQLAECPQLLQVVLDSGDSVSCTFTIDNYAPAAGSSLTDTVTVGGHQVPGGTPVTGSDTSTVLTRQPPQPGPDLAIVKNADHAKVKAGDTLTYTLTVTNVGDGPTTGTTTVTDTIPDGLDLVSVGTGSGWSCSTSGRSITCTYAGIVAAGQTLPDITVVTTVNDTAVGSVVNTGVVSTPGDVNPLNDRSTVKTPVTKVLPEKIVKPTTPTQVLPFTGDRTGQMLPVGLMALLLGLMLVAAGRRRRTA